MDRSPQGLYSAISSMRLEAYVSGESHCFEIHFQLTAMDYQTSVEGTYPSEEMMNRTYVNHYNFQSFISSLNQGNSL